MRFSSLVVVAAVIVVPGCRAQPSPESQPLSARVENAQQPAGPVRLARVIPDRLVMSGDRIAPQTLQVSYAIDDPQTVTDAVLELYHPDLFSLAKMHLDLPLAATGLLSFTVEPREHAIGPLVRFRVTCAGAATAWYVMGQIPEAFDAADATTFAIHGVRPESLPAHQMPAPPADPAVRAQVTTAEIIYVRAGSLSPACRLEAQVNGSDITLANVNLIDQGRAFQGLLYLRDIDFTPVARRYVELKLTVTRAGGTRHGATARLPLGEAS